MRGFLDGGTRNHQIKMLFYPQIIKFKMEFYPRIMKSYGFAGRKG